MWKQQGGRRQLCRSGSLGRHAGDPNFRRDQIECSAATSLLKKLADKDDSADIVVTMCRIEMMTGQMIVIDSGRYFH